MFHQQMTRIALVAKCDKIKMSGTKNMYRTVFFHFPAFPSRCRFSSPQAYSQETFGVKAARKRPLRRREFWCQIGYYWFSHDNTKIQTRKLLILLRFYFHDVQQQLKTSIHTNFAQNRSLSL